MGADRWWDDWHAEGRRRFGWHFDGWRFQCPECGLVHTPGEARGAGVRDGLHGCVCPEGLGGCGFPQQMGVKLTPRARYRMLSSEERGRLSGMVTLAKDSTRPVMRVLPFAAANKGGDAV